MVAVCVFWGLVVPWRAVISTRNHMLARKDSLTPECRQPSSLKTPGCVSIFDLLMETLTHTSFNLNHLCWTEKWHLTVALWRRLWSIRSCCALATLPRYGWGVCLCVTFKGPCFVLYRGFKQGKHNCWQQALLYGTGLINSGPTWRLLCAGCTTKVRTVYTNQCAWIRCQRPLSARKRQVTKLSVNLRPKLLQLLLVIHFHGGLQAVWVQLRRERCSPRRFTLRLRRPATSQSDSGGF